MTLEGVAVAMVCSEHAKPRRCAGAQLHAGWPSGPFLSPQNANLRYEALPNGDFQYIATRSIRKGEELFIDYGVDWWSDQNRSVTYCPPPEPQQAPPPHPDSQVAAPPHQHTQTERQ